MNSKKSKKKIKRIALKEVASTNDYAKEKRGLGRDLMITAKRQTGGRGTKGRSFASEEGGVYLTALRFHENCPAKEAFCLMASAAVAVCKTLETFGVKPVIKWANDIYVGGKKICGILVENTFSGENIACSVVGIGLNVNNRLPDTLREIATTLYAETGKKISVRRVTGVLIKRLKEFYPVEEYLERLGYMGRRAELVFDDKRVPATLLSVDREGCLWAEIDGEKRRFVAAEVSVIL